MSKTATVEVLTAEVHVVKVGSRQVTMSVFRQLDIIDHDLIFPFGRVRPTSSSGSHIWVIGRDDDDNLVRSHVAVDWPSDDEFAKHGHPFSERDEGWICQGRYLPWDWEDQRQTAKEWKVLPLIVLAGLT